MKKKMLSITPCFPIHPRLIKLTKVLSQQEEKFDELYCSYNLDNRDVKSFEENKIIFKKKYKNSLFGKVLRILVLVNETKKIIKENKIEVILCRGFIPLVIIFLSLDIRKYKVYYDVHDLLEGKNRKIYHFIEKKILKNVDKIILASRFYKEFYRMYENKVTILENYPSKKLYSLNNLEAINFPKNKKILSFIGIIRYYDIFEKILKNIKDKDINFLIFGVGPDEKKIKKYCIEKKIKNVYFFGEYSYKELHKFYNISDFIWAAYDYREENVRYAISNKFFENLAFDKIGIYSKNTKLGEIVQRNKIGLIVDPFDDNDLNKLFEVIETKTFELIYSNITSYKKENNIYLEDYISFK